MKYRFYFETDSYFENCHSLKHFKEKAKEEKRDIEIIGAKITYGEGTFYCPEFDEVGLTEDSGCGKECNFYNPRNGKSGRCCFHKNCYTPHGDKRMIKFKDKK